MLPLAMQLTKTSVLESRLRTSSSSGSSVLFVCPAVGAVGVADGDAVLAPAFPKTLSLLADVFNACQAWASCRAVGTAVAEAKSKLTGWAAMALTARSVR